MFVCKIPPANAYKNKLVSMSNIEKLINIVVFRNLINYFA